MAQRPKELTPDVSPAHRFGAELRRWRTGRGLSLDRLASLVHSTASTIGLMEKAQRSGNADIVARCDTVLEADGELIRLYADMLSARNRTSDQTQPWWLESSLRFGQDLSEAAPLLLEMGTMDIQRRDLFKTIAANLAVLPLVERDWLLALTQRTLASPASVGKSAPASAARAMITMLDDLDDRFGGGYARSTAVHYLIHEMLPMLRTPMPDSAHRELLALAAKLCAMSGWMSYDQGGYGMAQRYMTQGLRLCLDSGEVELAGQIFAGLSHLATACGHPAEGLALAEVGIATARRAVDGLGTMRIHAMAARAHAELRNSRAAARELHLAERALDASSGPDDESEWVRHLNAGYLHGETAQCLSVLGDHIRAGELASQAVTGSAGKGRRQTINLAVLATSRLRCREADLEAALDAAERAVAQLPVISSERSASALREFRRQLLPYSRHPRVQAFTDETELLLTAS